MWCITGLCSGAVILCIVHKWYTSRGWVWIFKAVCWWYCIIYVSSRFSSSYVNMISKFEDLFRWCISNKLTINAEKTNFVLFHTINKPIPQHLNEIKREFMTVMRVKSFKYLGLTLDEHLNWNEDMNELCKSLIQYFGIFNHIKYKITLVVVRQLYHAFIYSMIKYGIELYGSSSASNMNKVHVILNKLIKWYLN